MKHTKSHCDKCNKKVGVENLNPFPFLFMDRNDRNHPNIRDGYRQYYGCKDCLESDKKAFG